MNAAQLLPLIFATTAIAGEPPPQDRAAILGMAGEFKVTFHFQETVGFQPGYELKKPYTEDAHELVLVAKDEPRHIELQHLLIADGDVIKHWRQVWTFEDTRVCEFQGHHTWRMRDLTADEARGTWTQLVTQVDDSPRATKAPDAGRTTPASPPGRAATPGVRCRAANRNAARNTRSSPAPIAMSSLLSAGSTNRTIPRPSLPMAKPPPPSRAKSA